MPEENSLIETILQDADKWGFTIRSDRGRQKIHRLRHSFGPGRSVPGLDKIIKQYNKTIQ